MQYRSHVGRDVRFTPSSKKDHLLVALESYMHVAVIFPRGFDKFVTLRKVAPKHS